MPANSPIITLAPHTTAQVRGQRARRREMMRAMHKQPDIFSGIITGMPGADGGNTLVREPDALCEEIRWKEKMCDLTITADVIPLLRLFSFLSLPHSLFPFFFSLSLLISKVLSWLFVNSGDVAMFHQDDRGHHHNRHYKFINSYSENFKWWSQNDVRQRHFPHPAEWISKITWSSCRWHGNKIDDVLDLQLNGQV